MRNKEPEKSAETRCNADLMKRPMRKTNRFAHRSLAFDQEVEMKAPPIHPHPPHPGEPAPVVAARLR